MISDFRSVDSFPIKTEIRPTGIFDTQVIFNWQKSRVSISEP